MALTVDEKQRIMAEFARRRKRQLCVSIPLAAMVIGFILIGDNSDILSSEFRPAAVIGLFIAVLAVLIFSFRNWRCPGCNAYLHKNMNPRFCPRCGVQLHE